MLEWREPIAQRPFRTIRHGRAIEWFLSRMQGSRSPGRGQLTFATMPTAIVTGSGGLIGSECVRHYVERGFDVVGIENDMRARFFGPDASTRPVTDALLSTYSEFEWVDADIRDADTVDRVFKQNASRLELLIHTAAQPSHDWAAREPHTDFGVNAIATLNLLESARRHAPNATFIFASTNKVYGDRPNHLPLVETDTRLELPDDHRWYGGIDTSMSIDQSTHSLFGVSKAAADLMVQEYGRYFEMPTVCFRGGCLTGPSHAGAQLHGFLSFLMKCTVAGEPYAVFGYGGKQVRDNIHAFDVARFIDAFSEAPRCGEVYNIGGGRANSVSIVEAFERIAALSGKRMHSEYVDKNRAGDHICYISDLAKMRTHYPQWDISKSLDEIFVEIYEATVSMQAA
jgi:CDP-paratose 2-epimerase